MIVILSIYRGSILSEIFPTVELVEVRVSWSEHLSYQKNKIDVINFEAGTKKKRLNIGSGDSNFALSVHIVYLVGAAYIVRCFIYIT